MVAVAEAGIAAISAADTGHLVLSTIHTTNAATSVGRILDFFPSRDRETIRRQLGVNLNAILCQRLVAARRGGVLPAVEILRTNSTVRKLFEDGPLEKLGAAIESGGEALNASGGRPRSRRTRTAGPACGAPTPPRPRGQCPAPPEARR